VATAAVGVVLGETLFSWWSCHFFFRDKKRLVVEDEEEGENEAIVVCELVWLVVVVVVVLGRLHDGCCWDTEYENASTCFLVEDDDNSRQATAIILRITVRSCTSCGCGFRFWSLGRRSVSLDRLGIVDVYAAMVSSVSR
jgi:hypothetical protein